MTNAELVAGRPVSEWPPRAEVVLPQLKDNLFAARTKTSDTVEEPSKRQKITDETDPDLTQPQPGPTPWGGSRVEEGDAEVEIHGVDADIHEGEISAPGATTAQSFGSTWSWDPSIADHVPPTGMLLQAGVPIDECAKVLKQFYDRRSGMQVDGPDVPFSLTQTLNEWYEGLTDEGMRWLTTFSTQEERAAASASSSAISTASISAPPTCPEVANESSPPEDAPLDPVYAYEDEGLDVRPRSSLESEHLDWVIAMEHGDTIDRERCGRNPSRWSLMSEEERTAHKREFLIDIGTQSTDISPAIDSTNRRDSTSSCMSWDDNPRLDLYLKEHAKEFALNPQALMEVAERVHASESTGTECINVEGILPPPPLGEPVGPASLCPRPQRSVD